MQEAFEIFKENFIHLVAPINDMSQGTDECKPDGILYSLDCDPERYTTCVVADKNTGNNYVLKSKIFPKTIELQKHIKMVQVLSAINSLNCVFLMRYFGYLICENAVNTFYRKGLYRLLEEHISDLCVRTIDFENIKKPIKDTLILYFYDYKNYTESMLSIIKRIKKGGPPQIELFKMKIQETIKLLVHLLNYMQNHIQFLHNDFNLRNILLTEHEIPITIIFDGISYTLYYIPYIIDFDDSTIGNMSDIYKDAFALQTNLINIFSDGIGDLALVGEGYDYNNDPNNVLPTIEDDFIKFLLLNINITGDGKGLKRKRKSKRKSTLKKLRNKSKKWRRKNGLRQRF